MTTQTILRRMQYAVHHLVDARVDMKDGTAKDHLDKAIKSCEKVIEVLVGWKADA